MSPASLSKAVARLESEFEVKLFSREGRNIRLTDYGRLLQQKGSELIHAEESLKTCARGPRRRDSRHHRRPGGAFVEARSSDHRSPREAASQGNLQRSMR